MNGAFASASWTSSPLRGRPATPSPAPAQIDGWYAGYSRQTNPVFIWNTSNLASGTHTLQAVAWDELRRADASPVITVQK
jgi:hypothetical protein